MDFVAELKANNLKVTPQRLTIVEQLHKYGHLNIDDIYKELKSKFPSVSLATIYKNINAMIEISFLSEVKIPKQKSVYELTKMEHSHVVCTSCNNIMDIELNTTNLIKEASQLSNYTLCNSSIVFNGICNNCK